MLTPKDFKFLRWADAGAPIFSTCSKRQYMAVIVASNGRVVGVGYNGSPPGIGHCNEGACPRALAGTESGAAYDNCIAIHAEENAIVWSDRSMREGGTIYVNGPPCWQCGKTVAGSGIRRLVFIEDPTYADWPKVAQLLETAGVLIEGINREDL